MHFKIIVILTRFLKRKVVTNVLVHPYLLNAHFCLHFSLVGSGISGSYRCFRYVSVLLKQQHRQFTLT